MSQVIFNSQTSDGRDVRVQAGWDEPLQGYHFTVFNADDYDDPIWDALNHCTPMFPKTIDEFPPVLEELGIEPPDGFWEEVQQKRGNVFIQWKKNHWQESGV